MNDDLTREVVVVEDHDPEAVRWTRRSAGELGGFIGTVGDSDVFVSHVGPRSVDGYPVVPRPWDVVTAGRDGPDVEALSAVQLDGADADGSAAAFALDGALWLVADAGSSRLAEVFTWQVGLSEGVVWAAQGLPPWYCGGE